MRPRGGCQNLPSIYDGKRLVAEGALLLLLLLLLLLVTECVPWIPTGPT